MFTIIYDKESGSVLNITSESNEENLKEALPETSAYIFVDKLLEYNLYRQILVVKNNELVVEDVELNEEQEKQVVKMETIDKINYYKSQLQATDYKALKFIDGEFTEEEYAPIREERKEYRRKIRELEKVLIN